MKNNNVTWIMLAIFIIHKICQQNNTSCSYRQYFTYASLNVIPQSMEQHQTAIHNILHFHHTPSTKQTIHSHYWQYYLQICYFNITKNRYYLVFWVTKMLFQQIFYMLLSVIFGFLATNWVIFYDQKRFVDG